jgi:hypothetical protein
VNGDNGDGVAIRQNREVSERLGGGRSLEKPVSTCNSLVTGKITGNFTISAVSGNDTGMKNPCTTAVFDQFPTKINREIISGNREFSGLNREIW